MLVTMLFSGFSLAALGTAALGLPSGRERFAARQARRAGHAPAQLAGGHGGKSLLATSDVIYYDNWAGAVYSSPDVSTKPLFART
jgi:hypothetical protein